MDAIPLKLSDCKPGFIQEFCLRQGEMVFFSNKEPSVPCRNLAVKIADSDFPDGTTELGKGMKAGIVIVCSRNFPDGEWGYAWCSNQTKMIIAEFLIDLVKKGKWQYNQWGYLSFIDMKLMTKERFKEFAEIIADNIDENSDKENPDKPISSGN